MLNFTDNSSSLLTFQVFLREDFFSARCLCPTNPHAERTRAVYVRNIHLGALGNWRWTQCGSGNSYSLGLKPELQDEKKKNEIDSLSRTFRTIWFPCRSAKQCFQCRRKSANTGGMKGAAARSGAVLGNIYPLLRVCHVKQCLHYCL